MEEIIWIVFVLFIGACVGSFLNVVIYRLPRGQSIVFPSSHCPTCGRAIKWYDNIPLISWLALRGRCRFCKTNISPRYLLVEAVTSLLIVGLYVCYFILDIRSDAGSWYESWPMFIAHGALLCALLVCTIIDIEQWIIPLEVCWFVSFVGIASSAAAPHPWLAPVGPPIGAMSVGAAVGLILANVLAHYGLIQRSFIDADEPAPPPPPANKKAKGKTKDKKDKKGKKPKPQPRAVAATSEHGVNPRLEVLREVLFLAPAFILAAGALMLVTKVPVIRSAWATLTVSWAYAPHVKGLLAALFGYLIGGLLVWSTRILGTLGFGKEAMGLGDVHLMAAVGAITGWLVPTLAFFIAPVFGLLWALYLWSARNQRELPYGPWLALGTVAVMLFYDGLARLLVPYAEAFEYMFK